MMKTLFRARDVRLWDSTIPQVGLVEGSLMIELKIDFCTSATDSEDSLTF